MGTGADGRTHVEVREQLGKIGSLLSMYEAQGSNSDLVVFSWSLQLTLSCLRNPIPFSPNPNHSENLQIKRRHQKPSPTILAAKAVSSPEVASRPSPCLKHPAFGHTWAQIQFVADTSSLLTYSLYNLPAFVQMGGFSSLHLWDWRTHLGVALFK